MDDLALLKELEPVAESLLERHLSGSKEWFPHELVPWSRGRDFEPGEEWAEPCPPLPAGVASALFVNLLTEDNLPYYFRDIERLFGDDGAWGEWVRRWTAEEGRHSIVIRDYLTVTRLLDPVELERGRMAQVSGGEAPRPPGTAEGMVYVALQELATRIAHYNTGKLIDDPAGYAVMKRVAADENRHYLFYRDLVTATLELDPSGTVEAIERQVCGFTMPGTGIPGFRGHARAIADAGIYDFLVHHDQILHPVVMGQWRLADLEGLTPDAEQARERVVAHLERVHRAGKRSADRRASGRREHEAVSATP